MIHPNARVRGAAIYAAAGVPSKTLSTWETRGFLSRETGRMLPESSQGRALDYSVLDVCVLRLARELADLGMPVREAMREADDHRWYLGMMLTGQAAGTHHTLSVIREPASLDGGAWESTTRAGSALNIGDGEVARVVSLSSLVRAVVRVVANAPPGEMADEGGIGG